MIVHPIIQVESIEVDGQWFVDTMMNGRLTKRRGPFSADKAKAAADLLVKEFTPTLPATTNDDTIILNSKPVKLSSDLGRKLVVWACRAAENLVTDAEVRAEFELFDDTEWKAVSEHPGLIKALRQERFARINSGRAFRESAAKIVAKGPAELGKHLFNPATSPKHKTELHRELRQSAHGNGEESPADAAQLFHIVINLGENEKFEREVQLTPKPPQIEAEAVERESER